MATEFLVTGATGFVGRPLVAALEALGHVVHGLSSRHGDIASCALDFERVSHVFHLAARTFVPQSWQTPLDFYNTNVIGAANVLEFCKRRQASVTLLSSYVYGPPQRLPVDEQHPLQAFNPYALSKIMAEEMCGFYQAKHNIRATIIRPFNLYGPNQDERFLIPELVAQAIDPAKHEIDVQDKRPKRDYLYISDFIDLLLASAHSPANGIYNAGSGASISVEDLAALVNQAAGTNKPLRSPDKERPGEVMDVIADIGRARAELNWSPQVTLLDGLRAVVAAASNP